MTKITPLFLYKPQTVTNKISKNIIETLMNVLYRPL